MKKFISVLIIMLILCSGITVHADENRDYTNDGIEQYNLQDQYIDDIYKSGVELFSLANYTTKDNIYKALDNIISTVDVSNELEGVNKDNKEEIDRVMGLYFDSLYENPEIFYASNSVSLRYSYNRNTNEIISAELEITYLYDNNTILDMRKKLDEKVDYILENYLEGITNDLEKEYIIADYIVNNTTYDYDNYLNDSVPEISHTSYGSLINGIAVCDGYSKAASLLFGKVGIESGIIISDGMSHAWNYVNIENQYYHLDLTWNDPAPETNRTNYNYFNLSEEEMKRDHYGWNDMLYPSINGNSFSELRNLISKHGMNIARINDNLYYINNNNLYYVDLYGKNEKLVKEVGAYASNPIAFKDNIIYKDGSSIKRYNINTKTTSTISNENKIISKIYLRDDVLYIDTSNGVKTIELLVEGDINYDGIVDINDISLMALHYNKTSSSIGWKNGYDLNKDAIIDIFDLVYLSKKIS